MIRQPGLDLAPITPRPPSTRGAETKHLLPGEEAAYGAENAPSFGRLFDDVGRSKSAGAPVKLRKPDLVRRGAGSKPDRVGDAVHIHESPPTRSRAEAERRVRSRASSDRSVEADQDASDLTLEAQGNQSSEGGLPADRFSSPSAQGGEDRFLQDARGLPDSLSASALSAADVMSCAREDQDSCSPNDKSNSPAAIDGRMVDSSTDRAGNSVATPIQDDNGSPPTGSGKAPGEFALERSTPTDSAEGANTGFDLVSPLADSSVTGLGGNPDFAVGSEGLSGALLGGGSKPRYDLGSQMKGAFFAGSKQAPQQGLDSSLTGQPKKELVVNGEYFRECLDRVGTAIANERPNVTLAAPVDASDSILNVVGAPAFPANYLPGEGSGEMAADRATAGSAVAAATSLMETYALAGRGMAPSVVLRFKVGSDDLAVRIGLSNGRPTAEFVTKSGAVREAVLREWRATVGANSPLWGQEPVFNADLSAGAQDGQDGRPGARSKLPFAREDAPAVSRIAPAESQLPAALSTPPVSSGLLSAFA